MTDFKCRWSYYIYFQWIAAKFSSANTVTTSLTQCTFGLLWRYMFKLKCPILNWGLYLEYLVLQMKHKHWTKDKVWSITVEFNSSRDRSEPNVQLLNLVLHCFCFLCFIKATVNIDWKQEEKGEWHGANRHESDLSIVACLCGTYCIELPSLCS